MLTQKRTADSWQCPPRVFHCMLVHVGQPSSAHLHIETDLHMEIQQRWSLFCPRRLDRWLPWFLYSCWQSWRPWLPLPSQPLLLHFILSLHVYYSDVLCVDFTTRLPICLTVSRCSVLRISPTRREINELDRDVLLEQGPTWHLCNVRCNYV